MEKTGGSRLLQMQARFQQKQMQEREMKIASLYEAQQVRALDKVRHSPSNLSATTSPPHPTPPHQPGKVRQMFEERRTKGIDKSYPLQPIHNTDRPAVRKPLPNGYSKVTNHARTTVEKKSNKTHSQVTTHTIKRQENHDKTNHKIDNIVNGSGDLNHNDEPDFNHVKRMPQSNGDLRNTDEVDKADNNYLLENETFPEAMAPAPTPRSPDRTVEAKKPPPRRSPAVRSSPSRSKPQPPTAPPRRANENTKVSEGNKARGAMQKTHPVPKRTSLNNASCSPAGSKARAPPASAPAPGAPCSVCGRHFADDRIEKHEAICKKAHAKKRKPFDALKHRLAGTEAEPFINKLRKGPASNSKVKAKPINNNWRQKHEEFIQTIRAAKQVQQHLAAGGKLADLPPPPPSENPDYVQCPHCSRRFNQAAADRHIPKCATYQFNKPKRR